MALKALPFANPSGQYVAVPTVALTGDFTVEAWVTRTGLNGGGQGFKDSIFGHTGTAGPSINFYNDQFRLYDGSTDQRIASAASGNNVWHHFALVRSGSTFSIYVDGVLDTGATGTNSSSATFNFTSIGYGDGAVYFLDGQIEEFRVWNVARSGAQITANYNRTVDPASANLLAYFNFGESPDTNTTVTDLVAGTYTGTLQGSPTATRVPPTAPVTDLNGSGSALSPAKHPNQLVRLAAQASALLFRGVPAASVSSTVAVAATVPPPTSAVALASTDSLTVAAVAPVATSAVSLVSTDSLVVAATIPVATSAATLASTDFLAVAATVPVATMAATLSTADYVVTAAATVPVATSAISLASTDSLTVAGVAPVATLAANLKADTVFTVAASVPASTMVASLNIPIPVPPTPSRPDVSGFLKRVYV